MDGEADRDEGLERAAERGEVDLGVEAAQDAAAAQVAQARDARWTGAMPARSASFALDRRAFCAERGEERAVDVVEGLRIVRHARQSATLSRRIGGMQRICRRSCGQ